MNETSEDPLVPEEEFKEIPQPHRGRASAFEGEARVQQVLRWMDDNVKGKRLADMISKEFKVTIDMAYRYIRKAQELEETLINMTIPDIKKYCKEKYLTLTRARDKKVALQATDRLAKHASFFPKEQIDVTTRYDDMTSEQLEKLAGEEGS